MPRKKQMKVMVVPVQHGAGLGSFFKKAFKTGKKVFTGVKKFKPASKLLGVSAALGVPLPPQVQKAAMVAKQKGFGKKKRRPRRQAGGKKMPISY